MNINQEMAVRFRSDGNTKLVSDVNNYNAALSRGANASKGFNAASGQSAMAVMNFNRVLSDAPFGLIAVSNNIEPLIQSFTALRASTGSTTSALMAMAGSMMGPMGLLTVVGLVTGALVLYSQSQQKAASETKKSKKDLEDYVFILSKVSTEQKDLEQARKDLATLEEERKRLMKLAGGVGDADVLAQALSKQFVKVDRKGVERPFNSDELEKMANQIANSPGIRAATDRLAVVNAMIDDLRKKLGLIGEGDNFETQNALWAMNEIDDFFDERTKRWRKEDSESRAETGRQQVSQYLDQWDKAEKLKLQMREDAMEMAMRKETAQMRVLEAGFYGVANAIQTSFTRAFQAAFGEANSLLEQFLLAAGNRTVMELASWAIGAPGAGGILGEIFGVTSSSGRRGNTSQVQPMVVNLQIGKRTLRGMVADANAENARLRLA